MADRVRSSRMTRARLLAAAAAGFAFAIFLVDVMTPLNIIVAALYVAVVLLAARICGVRGLILVALGCVALTLLSYILHLPREGPAAEGVGLINAALVIGVIATTAVVALQARARQTRLREQARLLDLSHDTIFVRRMDDVITYWNRGAEQLYGWPSREAVGRVSHDLLATQFPAPLEEITAELLRSGRWEGELVHARRDGELVTIASRWSLQLDAQGRPAAILETNNDITERAHAEYLTRHVFESAPDAMCLVGRDGRFQRVNSEFIGLWGPPAQQIIGRPVAELIGAELFDGMREDLRRSLEGEEVTHTGWVSMPRGRCYLVVSYSPLRPAAREVEAALIIVRDLTEHMLESEALRAARAELEHVNRVATVGQLTASISHEVSQPVGAAVINAKTGLRWLARDPPDIEEARLALGRVVDTGERASEIIDRIRALVKKAPLNKSACNLNEIVRSVMAIVAGEAERHGVVVGADLAPEPPWVDCDRVQLQQVLVNLSVNAIEAMSTAGLRKRELRISTAVDAADGALVAVRDSGPGLDPQTMNRLFDAFYTTKPDGMGMGLSICRSIIDFHGGRLWAEANDPGGAVFKFTLPAAADEPAPAEPAQTLA